MILYAPAKVNLHLIILGKRPDGYHNINTIFERVALFDKIVLRSLPGQKIHTRGCRGNKTKISSDNPLVPTGKTSLIHRTISSLKSYAKVSRGIEVKIYKKIPIAAGLGGGSSDAASVLLGLNKMWNLGLKFPALCKIGKDLGADIPFFLSEKRYAVAKARGDEIKPLKWRAKFWHLLVFPPVRLLAKDVYAAYAKTSKKDRMWLTKDACLNKIVAPSTSLAAYCGIKRFLKNDLESVVLKKEPIVRALKNALKAIGLKNSLVSGSGPSVFTLFENRKEAEGAKETLLERFPFAKNKGWKIFVVSTV